MRLDEFLRAFDQVPSAEQGERVELCRRARQVCMIGANMKAAAKVEAKESKHGKSVRKDDQGKSGGIFGEGAVAGAEEGTGEG